MAGYNKPLNIISGPYVSMCGAWIKAISHSYQKYFHQFSWWPTKRLPSTYHNMSAIMSNCIRRTLYLAVLGQVDEDESRKKTRLRE